MKTLYLGDIHGSSYFKSLIGKYNDGNTNFFSTGDIFDRGSKSFENYGIMKDLRAKGLFDMVLGNHDLFFLIAIGFNPEFGGVLLEKVLKQKNFRDYIALSKRAYGLLLNNGGMETLLSIFQLKVKTGANPNLYDPKLLLEYHFNQAEKEEIKERLKEITLWLFNNFNISKIDKNNNLIIHGGLPLMFDGSGVNLTNSKNPTNFSKDLLALINTNFKNLDLETLEFLTLGQSQKYNIRDITSKMKELRQLDDPKYIDQYSDKLESGRHFCPTWFDSSLYQSSKRHKAGIQKQLKYLGVNSLICGHWWNQDCTVSEFNNINSLYWQEILKYDKQIYRIDRSFRVGQDKEGKLLIGNIGFLLVDKNNKCLEIGDGLKAAFE